MIPELEKKYQQLTESQKEIFRGYGLRQVKHFVELTLPKVEPLLPINATVIGVNAEGKVQAENAQTAQIYLWISDQQWQESQIRTKHIDSKDDFIEIWRIFDLAQMDLIHLSHVHRDFLEKQSNAAEL
ncbi:hypothetical protein [Acinetobacter stercoris]|uniref:Uncharacterized protein n=1 Tax=Acinetobacter stercoris TaxID=2126983 RepID=A0A2U3N4J2_9GAMM|nr:MULTISPECIES: hypothetical protein [Acinetobacter]SPL72495.1 hypothetical protein KPC_3673 [Acinetobacter stercoris]